MTIIITNIKNNTDEIILSLYYHGKCIFRISFNENIYRDLFPADNNGYSGAYLKCVIEI